MTEKSTSSRFVTCIPSDDTRERLVCSDCGWIHYENPRVIVAAVVRHAGQILLCRRAIRPRYGFWTLPGGFLEIGETPEQGACREVFEEAGAVVEIRQLLSVYAVPRIGQIHLVYIADLVGQAFAPGSESLDVRLFDATSSAVPWDELAFPVNNWTLRDYLSTDATQLRQPFSARPEDLMQRMSPIDFHPDFPPSPPGPDSPR